MRTEVGTWNDGWFDAMPALPSAPLERAACLTLLAFAAALQLSIAEGSALPATPPQPVGHAIEARLYAEDPRRGFLPAAGRLHRFRIDDRPGLRVDAGVADGSVVGVHYDPLLAKVVAHAPTRAEAAGLLVEAIGAAQVVVVFELT